MCQIGMITEQGDLGLGFVPVNEQEQGQIENNKDEDKKEGAK